MNIYEYKSSLHRIIKTSHVYSTDIELLLNKIERYWKKWENYNNMSRSNNKIDCPLKLYHLIEFPLDITDSQLGDIDFRNESLIIWFHYSPSKEELEILDSNYSIFLYIFDEFEDYNMDGLTKNPCFKADNLNWSNILELCPPCDTSDYIFLPFLSPITNNREDQDRNGFVINHYKTSQETRDPIHFNSDSCHIGFTNKNSGILVSKKDCYELLDSKIKIIPPLKEPFFTWLECIGCYIPETDKVYDTMVKTTISSYDNNYFQGIPPFHKWTYSKENTTYVKTLNTNQLIEYAWISHVSSKSEFDMVIDTSKKLSLSNDTKLYIYYSKSIILLDENIDKCIEFINLDDHLDDQKLINETLTLLYMLYYTPAKILVWFHPSFSLQQNINHVSKKQETIFFHRTQYFEKSYLQEDWLSNYITYQIQQTLVDVEQHIFKFAKQKDWFAVLVALWMARHIDHLEENTASQLLLIAMESIQLSYSIKKNTDLSGIIQDNLLFGYPEHTLDHDTWHSCLFRTHRIENIIKNRVPFEWKSSIGCVVSLANIANHIST